MFTFSKPRYQTKRQHPLTQKVEASYQFDVRYAGEMEESPISFLLGCNVPFTIKQIEEELLLHQDWWNTVLDTFLTATTSYFTRRYTVHHLQRILQHYLPMSSPFSSSTPQHICCIPRMMELIGGQLLIHWSYHATPAEIDIPDEISLPVSHSPKKGELEEWDVDAVPEQVDATEELLSPERLMDKQRVKEARLRAKLAVYRAQYQMNHYYDKYGHEVSESEGDSEEDEEDDEDA